MRLLIDDKIPFIRGEAERLGSCTYKAGAAITHADAMEADVLITRTRTHCNEKLLSHTPVRFIATATIGYDHLDTAYLESAGIAWANCPGCNAESVAQYVESSILCMAEEGFLHITPDFTLGIVGVGHVGRAVERMAKRRGWQVLRHDPPLEEAGGKGFVSSDRLRANADVISLHTPLTFSGRHPTHHLIDAAFFAKPFGKCPALISAGRGEVVETEALKRALREGIICAAAVDVWENEPQIDRELLDLAFIATPHVAGYSADGKAMGTQMALQAVADHFHLPQTFHIAPPSLPSLYSYNPALAPFCKEIRLYDPRFDTARLRAKPSHFELLRGNYPLRREKA